MKKLKRLLSVVLALTMILSLAAVAFAYEIDVYPASGAELNDGETYSAYKIFDVTVNTSTTPYSYSYSIDSSTNPFYSTIASLTDWFSLELQSGSTTVYTVTPTDALSALSASGEDLPSAVIEALATVDLTGVVADGTGTYSETTGYAAITLTEAGYYYVTTSLGSAVLIDTYSETLSVYDKNDTPSVKKEVYNAEGDPDNDYDSEDWDEKSYAQIGDTVYFQTTITNIADITKLTLHDGLEDGLTLDTTSITVYFVADGSDPTAVTLDTDVTSSCTITTVSQTHATPSFECDFEVVLDTVLSTYASSITDDSIIVVTYSATVNDDAEIYSESNDNNTYISYGDASYSEVDGTKTYVYKLAVYKYSSVGALAGVGFKLYYTDVNGTTQYVNVTQDTAGTDGAYTVNETTPTDTDPDNVTELITGTDGYIYVTGLDSDKTYYLTETTTPSGYNPLSGDIEVTINTDGTVTYVYNSTSTDADYVSVENKSGSELPGTGGIGTTIFYVVGGVLILGAVVLLITKKRMSNEEK